MTNKEFQDWISYYKSFPFDDFHRFHRPAALIVSKGKIDPLEESLKFLSINCVLSNEIDIEQMSEADISVLNQMR